MAPREVHASHSHKAFKPLGAASCPEVLESARRITDDVSLPTNPATGKPVILVPARVVNDLSTLNAKDWFDSNLNGDNTALRRN
jgi:hypothetical protein